MKIVERVKEYHINVIMKTGIYLKIFIHKLITPFLLFPFLFLLPTLLSFPPLLTLFPLSLLVTYVPKHLAKLFPWIFSLFLYKILFPLKFLIPCVCHKVVDTRYFKKIRIAFNYIPLQRGRNFPHFRKMHKKKSFKYQLALSINPFSITISQQRCWSSIWDFSNAVSIGEAVLARKPLLIPVFYPHSEIIPTN